MSNPLLDDLNEPGAIPYVEIALPTRGYFYPSGEVISDQANPEMMSIRSLSVLDESAFNDPLMMISGRAVARMVTRVTPQVVDAGRLCDIDVQVILLACRIASYGSVLKLEHTCPKCETVNKLELDLNEHIQQYDPFTPEEFANFDLVLPMIGQKVRLRPIPYQDSIEMNIDIIKAGIGFEQFKEMGDQDALTEDFINIYKNQFEQTLDANLHALVSSIYFVETKSGKKVYDSEMIEEWLTSILTKDVKAITDRIKIINDNLRERSKITYPCEKCKQENPLFVELDPQKLFTVAEDSETETASSAKSKPTKKTTKKASKVLQR